MQSHDNLPPSQTNQPFQPYPIQPGVVPPTPGVMPKIPRQRRHHPWGLIISLILTILLLMGAVGFGVWAFMSQQDYKNNSDQKSAAAVQIAVQQESTRKDKEFVELEKKPLKAYQGPEPYGSLIIKYPKTWGAYVIEANRSSKPVEAYFHPNYVPGIDSGTAFALRLQISNQAYAQEMKQFDAKVKAGKLKVSPYTPKNVPGLVGSRVEGEINTGQKDVMILLPLRDKTIKLSTEAEQFVGDFDKIILENFTFVP